MRCLSPGKRIISLCAIFSAPLAQVCSLFRITSPVWMLCTGKRLPFSPNACCDTCRISGHNRTQKHTLSILLFWRTSLHFTLPKPAMRERSYGKIKRGFLSTIFSVHWNAIPLALACQQWSAYAQWRAPVGIVSTLLRHLSVAHQLIQKHNNLILYYIFNKDLYY
jgi:hypothetical protein